MDVCSMPAVPYSTSRLRSGTLQAELEAVVVRLGHGLASLAAEAVVVLATEPERRPQAPPAINKTPPEILQELSHKPDSNEVVAQVELAQAVGRADADVGVHDEAAERARLAEPVVEELQALGALSPLEQEIHEVLAALVREAVVADVHTVKRARADPGQMLGPLLCEPPAQAVVAEHGARQVHLAALPLLRERDQRVLLVFFGQAPGLQ